MSLARMGLLIACIFFIIAVGDAESYVVESGYAHPEVTSPPGEVREVPFYSLPLHTILGVGAALVCPALLPLVDLLFSLSMLATFGIRRLNRRNVLEHEGRSAVYQCIRTEPGVRFTEILATTGLNRGTAEYHLHVLEQTGKIRHLDSAGYVDTLQPAVPEIEARLRAAIRSETSRKILERVARRKDIDRTILSSELGLPGPLLSYHLRRLVDAGIVNREHRGRTVRYSMSDTNSQAYLESIGRGRVERTTLDLRFARSQELVQLVPTEE
jgi:predicted transcriptional regulator